MTKESSDELKMTIFEMEGLLERARGIRAKVLRGEYVPEEEELNPKVLEEIENRVIANVVRSGSTGTTDFRFWSKTKDCWGPSQPAKDFWNIFVDYAQHALDSLRFLARQE